MCFAKTDRGLPYVVTAAAAIIRKPPTNYIPVMVIRELQELATRCEKTTSSFGLV